MITPILGKPKSKVDFHVFLFPPTHEGNEALVYWTEKGDELSATSPNNPPFKINLSEIISEKFEDYLETIRDQAEGDV